MPAKKATEDQAEVEAQKEEEYPDKVFDMPDGHNVAVYRWTGHMKFRKSLGANEYGEDNVIEIPYKGFCQFPGCDRPTYHCVSGQVRADDKIGLLLASYRGGGTGRPPEPFCKEHAPPIVPNQREYTPQDMDGWNVKYAEAMRLKRMG